MQTQRKVEPLMASVKFDALAGYRAVSMFSDRDTELWPLARTNIFIGENNSGKSRFLRWLSRRKLTFQPSDEILTAINALADTFKADLWRLMRNGQIKARGYVDRAAELLNPFRFITEDEKYIDQYVSFAAVLKQASGSGLVEEGWDSYIARKVSALGDEYVAKFQGLNLRKSYSFPKFYIPTLRSLRAIRGHTQRGDNDIFRDLTHEEYFRKLEPGEAAPTIFTGLNLYNQYKALLLGVSTGRQWVRDFERFIGETFYSGRNVTIIPHIESGEIGIAGTLIIQIGNQEFPISQVGDGIQSTILLTFPLFEHKDKEAIFFFDEPEAFLHPAFQRVFLNVLRRKDLFPNHQYFFTTHSNHLLDMTAEKEDISIFTFKREMSRQKGENPEANKTPSFIVENVANDNMQPLALLGVRNSSVLLSNCTVWVEGITDRRYLARWLKLYTDADTSRIVYREDLHFSFVEYSGGNITHWSFLDKECDAIKPERLCAKLFLIADHDNAKPGSEKAKRAEKLKQALGERFYPLPCREIENLLTPAVVSAVVKDKEGVDISFGGVKQKIWNAKGLGTLIEEASKKAALQTKRRYAAESGTVANKVDFCAHALQHMNTFSDLSPGAQELIVKVYEFIRQNNT